MFFALTRRRALASLGAVAFMPPSWAAPSPSLSVPRLPLAVRRLGNGLTVISIPDPGSATVAVQVWMRVGGKNDPEGRSGFAHLFEHLMFKGTKNMPAGMFDRLTEDVGGMNNAFTAEDVTAYHEVVPSNHLERLLWAEAERMANLDVSEENFKSERAVVQEEYRQRVLANPYGRLFNAIPGIAFEVHPYKRPVIGSIEDLQAATLADVRAFHARFYRPDNAILIVAGDFDAPQLQAWVDRYFGPLKAPQTPIPTISAREPQRKEGRHVELHGPNVPLPAAALLWQGPKAASDDAAALNIAAALLSAGESSRLHESLVYRQQLAQGAGFSADLYADAGLLVAYAIAAGRATPDQLVAALREQIERLAREPIPDAELDKVRTQLLTRELVQRQTPLGKGQAVGWATILRGDPRAADRELDELQAVRAPDVQRVLRRWVLDAKAIRVTYTQKENSK
jgi:zinc protease